MRIYNLLILFIALSVGCASNGLPQLEREGHEYPASHQTKVPNEFWCLPGCLLDNNSEDKPIIPKWCTAWGNASETMCVKNGDEDLCFSGLVGPSFTNTDPKIDDYLEKNSSRLSCLRIDSEFLPSASEARAGEFLLREPPQFGVVCRPGCISSAHVQESNWCLDSANFEAPEGRDDPQDDLNGVPICNVLKGRE